MNFIALIGIVENLVEQESIVELNLKIEKPFLELSDKTNYDNILVELDREIFKTETTYLNPGAVVGVKGRIKPFESTCKIIGERLQVF